MPTQSKRQKRLASKKKTNPWLQLDLDQMPHPKWMTRAYRNDEFMVMVDDHSPTDKGEAVRVMVRKHTETPIINHWSTMMNIKNQLFGPETVAVEYYPKMSELIDDHNIYWFWIFPEDWLPKTMFRTDKAPAQPSKLISQSQSELR